MRRKTALYLLLSALVLLNSLGISAESFAQSQVIEGFVQAQDGNPLAGAVVSIFQENWVDKALVTARSEKDGSFVLNNLLPGKYVINVIKSGYKPLTKIFFAPVSKLPVFIVLSSAVAGENDEENWDVKNVLRASREKNLIFRAREEDDVFSSRGTVLKEGDNQATIRSGTIQVTTSQPLGSLGYQVLPGTIGAGFSTRFAYVEPLGKNTSYIVTGLITTGMDSEYRLRNLLNYQVGVDHQLQLKIDYSKMGTKERAIHDLANPEANNFKDEILHTIKPIQHVSLGIQDVFQIFEPLTMVYGFDINYSTIDHGKTLISPRFQVYFTPSEKLAFRFQFNNERKTYDNTILLPEGEAVTLYSPFSVTKVNNTPFLNRHQHMETGLSFFLDDKTSLEITTFLDEVAGSGYQFVAILKNPSYSSVNYGTIPDDMNDSHGFRFNLTRQWTKSISTSVLYIYGSGTELSDPSAASPQSPEWLSALKHRFFNTFSTSFDAKIHSTGTDISTIYRRTNGSPLTPMDPYSNYYNVNNNTFSVFIRQKIPLFENSLGRWEAILDIRNILNKGVSVYETPSGDLILVRSPRSFRGGINFRF